VRKPYLARLAAAVAFASGFLLNFFNTIPFEKADLENKKAPWPRVLGQGAMVNGVVLSLFDGDCVFRAYFNATLASQTFLSVRRDGFPVPHLEHLYWADIHAFFAANAFFFVDGGVKGHQQISFRWFMIFRPRRTI
jgi:hypothetical protein